MLTLAGLKSRSFPISSGFVVYRLRAVLDSQQQNDVRAALKELGALDAVQENGATFEATSRYLAGPCELPEASQLATFERKLVAEAERLGIEAAHFFELATELGARPRHCEDSSGPSWKAGPPPMVQCASFPLQGLEATVAVEADEVFEELSVAVKLATCEPGTHTVLDAFHTFWLRAYVDTDSDADTADFRGISVSLDAEHCTGMLAVDNAGSLPISLPDVVHHLVWVLEQLHTVIPVVHARLNPWCVPARERFLLAGNPLLEHFARGGEAAALAWLAAPSSMFDATERAAMCVELGQTFDPSSETEGTAGIGWFDRALALVPDLEVALGSKITVLVRCRRLAEALAVVAGELRGEAFVLRSWSEVAPEAIEQAADLLTTPVLDVMNDDVVAGLVPIVAEHAPALLARLLAALPAKDTLAGHLTNAVNSCSEAVKLTTWLRIVDLPLATSGPHRENHLIALNSACVTAHARKDFELAAQLADRAQPYLEDNPYLTHSCACAYAAVGRLDEAMAQVERGVGLNYDHSARMETDSDLDPIRRRPEFTATFARWRARAAQTEPVQWADSTTFDPIVLGHGKPVLVDFTASWCRPCKTLSPILEKLAASSGGDFRVVKVDVDASPHIAERYDIRSMPTLVLFRGGAECARRSGLTDLVTLRRFMVASTPTPYP